MSAYSHWNEEARRVWYEENRYDMEHADEIIEDDEPWFEEPDEGEFDPGPEVDDEGGMSEVVGGEDAHLEAQYEDRYGYPDSDGA